MTAGMSSVTEAVSHLPPACGSRGFPLPFGRGLRFLLLLLRGALMTSSGVARDRAAS